MPGNECNKCGSDMSNHSARSMWLCGSFVLLLAMPGCGPLVLSVDDTVVMNGNPGPFSAYVSREHVFGLRSEIEHVPVAFLVDGRKIGENTADDEGRAGVMTAALEGEPQTCVARAQIRGKTLDATGRVFHWQRGRVIIAVDIDHTISQTNYRKLLLKEQVDISPPIPGARETLEDLAKDYYILYLTARPRFLIEKTRDWLVHYNFPSGPVVAAPSVRDAVRQLGFKRRTLHELRQRWPALLIGIGNQTTDIEAYASSRMLPVIVYNGGEEKHYSDAVVLQDWQFVRGFFDANSQILTSPPKLEKVIDGQLMILQPLVPYEAAKSHHKPKQFEGGDSPANQP